MTSLKKDVNSESLSMVSEQSTNERRLQFSIIALTSLGIGASKNFFSFASGWASSTVIGLVTNKVKKHELFSMLIININKFNITYTYLSCHNLNAR